MTRIRVRTPAPPVPAARTRQRPVNPGSPPVAARVRLRAPTAPTYPWRLTNEKLAWALEAPKERLLTLGEIDPARRAGLWAGWPNGSCFNAPGGGRHLGRHIKDPATGKYHVLRWNGLRKVYLYAGLLPHDVAMSILK